jgi:hypothetical protein
VTAARPQASLHHERGPSAPDPGQPVAVIAHWSPDERLTRSVETLVAELDAAGYFCALVSTSASPRALVGRDCDLWRRVAVVRRPNIGYDFGSWASYLNARPEVRRAPLVLLVNDSLVGPFASLSPILESFAACPTDIWGLTSTTQDWPHLQSHFVGYKDGILEDPALRRFWERVRVQPSKRRLILNYEIGLSQLAYQEGFLLAAHFPWHWVTALGQNPTSLAWRRLIALGFPFVKRELVRTPPPEVVDAVDIPAVVRRTWGEDVHAWL